LRCRLDAAVAEAARAAGCRDHVDPALAAQHRQEILLVLGSRYIPLSLVGPAARRASCPRGDIRSRHYPWDNNRHTRKKWKPNDFPDGSIFSAGRSARR
jgi:hypothetical protein